jgi:hypothetical protein
MHAPAALNVRGLSLRWAIPRLRAAFRGRSWTSLASTWDVCGAIALAVADAAGEVRYQGEIANTPEAIAKLVTQLKRGARVQKSAS